MNKKLTITTAMAATLLTLPACSGQQEDWDGEVVAERDTAVCVDQSGNRVDDDMCNSNSLHNGGYHGGGGSNAFLWYYLGRSSAVPYYGESIHDRRFAGQGAYQPKPNTVYERAPSRSRMTRSQAVSRGGLGSSGFRFGGSRS
jgi:hypothetical protein